MRCNYCNKKIHNNDNIWHIDEAAEDYCYQDINTYNDIQNSCIGKELLKCGYSKEKILKLFQSDLDDREFMIYYTIAYE